MKPLCATFQTLMQVHGGHRHCSALVVNEYHHTVELALHYCGRSRAMRDWLVEANISYTLAVLVDDSGEIKAVRFSFENLEDSLLFKITFY